MKLRGIDTCGPLLKEAYDALSKARELLTTSTAEQLIDSMDHLELQIVTQRLLYDLTIWSESALNTRFEKLCTSKVGRARATGEDVVARRAHAATAEWGG